MMSKKFNIKEWQEKHLLKEHALGDLPSDKLMKMKWNPVTNPVKEDVYRGDEWMGDPNAPGSSGPPDDWQEKERQDNEITYNIPFTEFMVNIQNWSNDSERNHMLDLLTEAIFQHMDDAKINDLKQSMLEWMADNDIEVGPDGARL